jgi:molecular chaperone DnaK (HSP70)
LTVDAKEESSGTEGSITIENKKGRLSEEQIQDMIKEDEKIKASAVRYEEKKNM